MKGDYVWGNDEYIIKNTTRAEGQEATVVEKKNPESPLGIDEKNYSPLKASRRVIEYVEK